MAAQTGYFDTLKSVAGKVFSYLASITITGVDGKTLTVNDNLTLALGSADLKQFMNAAGTALEWDSGLKIGTFTYDTATATGTQAITGVGFKPKLIIIFAALDATKENSIGVSDGSAQYCQYDYGAVDADKRRFNTTNAIWLQQGASDIATATISPIGADGFTINWNKAGAKTGTATLFYIAIR